VGTGPGRRRAACLCAAAAAAAGLVFAAASPAAEVGAAPYPGAAAWTGTRIWPDYRTVFDTSAVDRPFAMVQGAVNFVAHGFAYSIETSNATPLITAVSGATWLGPGNDSVSGTYYEPVWQGWSACATGPNIYDNACPDGEAPAFYYRGGAMSGLFTLPRYDGMIYGFAGAADATGAISSGTTTHDVAAGSNAQVQPLVINVDRPGGYTPASTVLGSTVEADTASGQATVNTSDVDAPITVRITPEATVSGRYTTAFYTQDWMYWGSEARDQSNASPVKWTSGSGRLYDELTAPNDTYQTTDLFRPSSSYEAMSYIPTSAMGTKVDSAGSAYTANQSGIPNSLDGVDGRLQGGGDPLTNPDNPTFTASYLVTVARGGGTGGSVRTIAALYGSASDNDGMIWLGGLGGNSNNSSHTNSYTDAITPLNAACANIYYVADDVKLRFAYPAGKAQEPVEHYYYPTAFEPNTRRPLFSTGRNDGSGVYDLNCGLSLYGNSDLTSFTLTGAQAPWFRGGSLYQGLGTPAWNQPFVRTTASTAPGWTYDRAAATSDSSDRAKESNLHPGDQLPSTEIALRDSGSAAGSFPTTATESNGATVTAGFLAASPCTYSADTACALLSPDTAKAVLVDSQGRAPADPYDDSVYWYTIRRATVVDGANTTVTNYTGSYLQADGSTGNLAVNNTGLAAGADQGLSPAASFDQREYAETATDTGAGATSYSSNYARTSPLLRAVGQQLRQTCWTSALGTDHTCGQTAAGAAASDPLGPNDNREWVLDTSDDGNRLQDGYHVANLGTPMLNDSDGDGALDAGATAVKVYPTYTVPAVTIPQRAGYTFAGYRVKAYGTAYTRHTEAQCWDYDNLSIDASGAVAGQNGVADYLDLATAAGLAAALGWNSTVSTVCANGGLGYTYTGIATAVPAVYGYDEVVGGLTTIYVNGRPYIDGTASSYSSGDFDSVAGAYVNTGGVFKKVDTHDVVIVQPGDEIIPVGTNLKGGTGADKTDYFDFYPDDTFGWADANQYRGACSEPTVTVQSVCVYRGYTWTAYDGLEAPLWYLELEPVWVEEANPPTPPPTVQPPTPEPPEPETPEPEAPEPEGEAIVEAPEPEAPGLANTGNNLIPYSPVFVFGFLFCAITCFFASYAVRREEEDAARGLSP
jgi:hypothetical protein